jgi:hypothetical protein
MPGAAADAASAHSPQALNLLSFFLSRHTRPGPRARCLDSRGAPPSGSSRRRTRRPQCSWSQRCHLRRPGRHSSTRLLRERGERESQARREKCAAPSQDGAAAARAATDPRTCCRGRLAHDDRVRGKGRESWRVGRVGGREIVFERAKNSFSSQIVPSSLRASSTPRFIPGVVARPPSIRAFVGGAFVRGQRRGPQWSFPPLPPTPQTIITWR